MVPPCFCVSDDLIILNKPYGIGLSPPPPVATQHLKHRSNTLVGERQYYLTEALPYIAENLGYSNLTVLKIPERFVLVFYAHSKALSPALNGYSFIHIFCNCTTF
jgi:hypothetical protein